MLFYRLLQQSVNTDPHPLYELIGGTAAVHLAEPEETGMLSDNGFQDF